MDDEQAYRKEAGHPGQVQAGANGGVHLKGDTERDVKLGWNNIHRAGKVALHVCGKDPVRDVVNNHCIFAGHMCRIQGPYIPLLLHAMNSCRWDFVISSGRLHVNRWDQHLADVFSVNLTDLANYYMATAGSPYLSAMEPTGWSVHAAEQVGRKRLRDEKITQMIFNLGMNLCDTSDEVARGLEYLHAVGHMTNISLRDDFEDCVKPLASVTHASSDDSALPAESAIPACLVTVNRSPGKTMLRWTCRKLTTHDPDIFGTTRRISFFIGIAGRTRPTWQHCHCSG